MHQPLSLGPASRSLGNHQSIFQAAGLALHQKLQALNPVAPPAPRLEPPTPLDCRDTPTGRYLFFDVETQGLGQHNQALQLCSLLVNIQPNDHNEYEMTIEDEFNGYFNVDFVSPGAEKIHGISKDHLDDLEAKGEINHWQDQGPKLLMQAQKAKAVVGHNLSFDIRSIGNTLKHHHMHEMAAEFESICQTKKHCTLKMARQWGKSLSQDEKPENNRLSTIYPALFHEPLVNAHDAMADTLASASVYFALLSRGVGVDSRAV